VSTKQIRIADPVLLRARLREFVNRKINLILNDNTVVFGELKKTDDHTLYLVNMRLKKIRIPIKNVIELFADINA
jgi:small nuclear ribonucleoprotein (snRNP)-like protein